MHASIKALIYFLSSIIITYIFIDANPVYNTIKFKIVALIIAAVVWGIQVAGAFIFLTNKKYPFLKEAGKVCFWGSVSLMASVLINYFISSSTHTQLKISAINVLLSVVLMAVLFANFLQQLKLSYKWLIVWLLCLCVAVPVQAKLVGLW